MPLESYPGDPLAELIDWTRTYLHGTPDEGLCPCPWIDFTAQPACTLGPMPSSRNASTAARGTVSPAAWTRAEVRHWLAVLLRAEGGYAANEGRGSWPWQKTVMERDYRDGSTRRVTVERMVSLPCLSDPVDALKLLTYYRASALRFAQEGKG